MDRWPTYTNFPRNAQEYQAIEQNPEKPNRSRRLAQEGHNVVQFKSPDSNR